MDSLIQEWSKADPEKVKAWGPVLIGLLAIITGFIANIVILIVQKAQNRRQNDFNARQLNLARSKEERDEIIEKLNTFYGPFKELRTESRLLYQKFALDLKKQYQDKNEQFRTLRYLLEKGKFSMHDQQLLGQILEINDQILKLIESNSGVVDRPELQELLGREGAHIRILQLAMNGQLSGPPDAFEDIVYPLAIDGAIESAILRLQDRLKELGGLDSEEPPQFGRKECDADTVRYYDTHVEEYANQTMFVDMSELYLRFRQYLPGGSKVGGRILDAGCGVGRDTRYFIEHGFIVISFDASREMVRKCHEYPHAYCTWLSFAELNFKEEFDGIWACASLLHLPLDKAKDAVMRLTTALKPGGVMLVSLKKGKGHQRSQGRFFQYYNDEDIDELLKLEMRLETLDSWQFRKPGFGDNGDTEWLNLILKRKEGLS